MSKRSFFTTLTPLPPGISRATVMETLHSHTEMIDLNPLVEERHPIKPPPEATAEEYHCQWYSLTDRVSYLPGGLITGKVSYNACFHDLDKGLQTHCYAPMGLNIKGKWTLGGTLPGEPVAPVELGLGAPVQGLYLREDVEMKCNIMMTSFVKKTLKKAHSHLVDRLVMKAQIVGASASNQRLSDKTLLPPSQFSGSQASTDYSPSSDYGDSDSFVEEARDPQRYNQYPPQIPPMQNGSTFRGPDNPDFRDKTNYNDESLYPRALSLRSSSGSYNGSMTGSQNPRASYQDPGNSRVSWQNLNPQRSPQPQPAEPTFQQQQQQQQQPQPYRASSYSYHAELPSNKPRDAGPERAYTPPSHAAAELE